MRLFRDIKAAQQEGKMGTFFQLGRSLQARFPNSNEAQVSRILLGRALVQGGSSAEALAQFDAYGRRGGAMLEEALLGQARTSARLGMRSRELQAWRDLVKTFPDSVHAPQAAKRIAKLNPK